MAKQINLWDLPVGGYFFKGDDYNVVVTYTGDNLHQISSIIKQLCFHNYTGPQTLDKFDITVNSVTVTYYSSDLRIEEGTIDVSHDGGNTQIVLYSCTIMDVS